MAKSGCQNFPNAKSRIVSTMVPGAYSPRKMGAPAMLGIKLAKAARFVSRLRNSAPPRCGYEKEHESKPLLGSLLGL